MAASDGPSVRSFVAIALAVAIAASIACGDDVPGRHLVGTSRHFRLFVGGDGDPPIEPAAWLEALETNWADAATMLRQPEAVIDYHLFDPHDVATACGINHAAACQLGREIYTSATIDQHELNHAYMELRAPRSPAALLVEGFAEAFGCYEGASPAPRFGEMLDWRRAIASASYSDVSGPGRQLARHLILTHGIDRFIEYYAAAPNTRDPDRFASTYAEHWGTDLDTVWAAMAAAQPAWGPESVMPICPCSLPPWTASETPMVIGGGPSHPYWTWPTEGGETAVFSGQRGSVRVSDCRRRDLRDFLSFDFMFARLEGPLFLGVSGSATATRGRFLSASCDDAAWYPIPGGLVEYGSSGLVPIVSAKAPGTALSEHLALEATEPIALSVHTGVGAVDVCAGCDGNGAATGCQPMPNHPSVSTVQGRFYLHWRVDGAQTPQTSWPYAAIYLRIGPPPG